jgi:hypothetical protein
MWRRLSGILFLLLFSSRQVFSQPVLVEKEQLLALEQIFNQLKLESNNLRLQYNEQISIIDELNQNLQNKEHLINSYKIIMNNLNQNLESKESLTKDLQTQLHLAENQSTESMNLLAQAQESLVASSKQQIRNTIIIGAASFILGGITTTIIIHRALPHLTRR